MSNLGRYQEFTTAAKAAGGVDEYLRELQRASNLRVAGATLVVTGGALMLVAEIRQRRALRRLREEGAS